MLNPITEEDQSILDWFESQSEETLRDLSDRFDAGSPREFWTAFLADCTPPAQDCPGDSLAAPAEAGQVVCNPTLDNSLSGFQQLDASRTLQPSAKGCAAPAHGKRSAGAGAAQPAGVFQALPDGNHGDNRISHT